MENILNPIIPTAGIPNGCAWKDWIRSPLKSHEMECPSPHPGHQ